MISREFTIERNFIRFLVGGGSFATTQIRLAGRRQGRPRLGRPRQGAAPVRPLGGRRVPRQAGAPGDRGPAAGPLGSHQHRPDHVLRPARRSGHAGAPRGAPARAVPRPGDRGIRPRPGERGVVELVGSELREGARSGVRSRPPGAPSRVGQGPRGAGAGADPRSLRGRARRGAPPGVRGPLRAGGGRVHGAGRGLAARRPASARWRWPRRPPRPASCRPWTTGTRPGGSSRRPAGFIRSARPRHRHAHARGPVPSTAPWRPA